jgi:hypothetical protein
MSAAPLPDAPQPAGAQPLPRTPRRTMLSLVPTPVQARRAPFVALLLVLLAGGLVGLLLLNTASAQDAFKLHALQSQAAVLSQETQVYASKGDGLDNPATLAARAARLGLVAGNAPVFLARGAALPAGSIRIGNLVYIPAPVVVPIPAPPVAKATIAPVAKTPVPKKTIAPKTPVAATKTGTAKTATTGTAKTGTAKTGTAKTGPAKTGPAKTGTTGTAKTGTTGTAKTATTGTAKTGTAKTGTPGTVTKTPVKTQIPARTQTSTTTTAPTTGGR